MRAARGIRRFTEERLGDLLQSRIMRPGDVAIELVHLGHQVSQRGKVLPLGGAMTVTDSLPRRYRPDATQPTATTSQPYRPGYPECKVFA